MGMKKAPCGGGGPRERRIEADAIGGVGDFN